MKIARLVLVMVLVALCAIAVAADPAAPGLGGKVVQFCEQNLNKKVGNGQCAGLATRALRAARARSRAGPDSPGKGDYVWGRHFFMLEGSSEGSKPTGDLTDIQPGDIIQLRDVHWGGTRHAAHHTQVVASVDVQSRTIEVYQQNAGGHQFVLKGSDVLDRLQGGWLRIYRPVPAH